MSYCIWIGKHLTADGRAYLAGYGDEPSSHWLELVPGHEHESGAQITVGMSEAANMPGVLTQIPQVARTARHLRVSYSHYEGVPAPITNGGLNEHGVAVRDVWSPSNETLHAMTSPNQTGPNYSDLARIVLERATTARAGVELIGALIAEHGYSTYGGNSHMIADADEAWVVIEFAGSAGLWVAERLGPDVVRVSRPGYIGEIPRDFMADPDYLGAPHLIEFACERGWYHPDRAEPFDVNRVLGDGKGLWAGARWMTEDMRARAARPGRITFDDVTWAVRTERLTGDTAGYGQIVPLGAVSSPDELVLWHAPCGAIAAPFTPFLLGVDQIPVEFGQHRYLTVGEPARFHDERHPDATSAVPQRVEATEYAHQLFKRLLLLVCEHHELFLSEVTPVWEAFERECAERLAIAVDQAAVLRQAGRNDLATLLMTSCCAELAQRSLRLGRSMLDSMEARSRVLFGIRTATEWIGPEQIW
jgi:dipeptidase